MTYSEKLKDPRWQRRRLEILERDGWACTNCEAKDQTLHVHHKRYERGKQPWESDDDDLETLCEWCHTKETFQMDEIMFLLARNIEGRAARDAVLGLLRAMDSAPRGYKISFGSYEEAEGVGYFCGVSADRVIEHRDAETCLVDLTTIGGSLNIYQRRSQAT